MSLITKTRNGKKVYVVRFNVYKDPITGKRRCDEKQFSRRKDALNFQRRATVSTNAATERITVADLGRAWIDANRQSPTLRTKGWAKRTTKDYEAQLRLRIAPFLGSTKCAHLTTAIAFQWQNWMLAQTSKVSVKVEDPRMGCVTRQTLERPTSAATANKSLRALQAMIRWGRSVGLTECRCLDDARPLRTTRAAPPRPYTPPEVERIADGCQLLRDATLIKTLAYSGLRWSEMCALRWDDIDWERSEIAVTKALDLDRTMKAPKSEVSRTVPLLEPGMAALSAWRDHHKSVRLDDLVFANEAGRPLSSNWYRHDRNLGRIRRACGIDFEPHQLRDTYASILIQSGIGEAELTLWLGHKSIQTTITNYSALFPARKTHLASMANELIAAIS